MSYTPAAMALRRCTAIRKDGRLCQAWALWTAPGLSGRQLCRWHSQPGPRGPYRNAHLPPGLRRPTDVPTRRPNCTCPAYAWPHRPGGGLCRWPEPPASRLLVPAGTHSWPRATPELKAMMRRLERRWRKERPWASNRQTRAAP